MPQVLYIMFDLLSSGPQRPDTKRRDGPEPGPVQPKRTKRLHPEAGLSAGWRVRVWPHHAHQRTVAQTRHTPRDGQHQDIPKKFSLSLSHWVFKKSLLVLFEQVISAQQLPKVNEKLNSIVDPLVRVEIYGVPADTAKKETQHIENNGSVSVSSWFTQYLNMQ